MPLGTTTYEGLTISGWERSGVRRNNGCGVGFTWGEAAAINSDEGCS